MREVARDEVSFASGFPVTTPERTVFDLVADDEDLPLVADALHNACVGSRPFDFNKLEALVHGKYGKNSQGGFGTRRQAVQPRLESAVQRIAVEPRKLGLEIGADSLRLPSDDAEPDFARLPYR